MRAMLILLVGYWLGLRGVAETKVVVAAVALLVVSMIARRWSVLRNEHELLVPARLAADAGHDRALRHGQGGAMNRAYEERLNLIRGDLESFVADLDRFDREVTDQERAECVRMIEKMRSLVDRCVHCGERPYVGHECAGVIAERERRAYRKERARERLERRRAHRASVGLPVPCQITEWGTCPEHGATLRASGGRSWCKVPDCGRSWDFDRMESCVEQARWTARDVHGTEVRCCDGHAIAMRNTEIVGLEIKPLPGLPARPVIRVALDGRVSVQHGEMWVPSSAADLACNHEQRDRGARCCVVCDRLTSATFALGMDPISAAIALVQSGLATLIDERSSRPRGDA